MRVDQTAAASPHLPIDFIGPREHFIASNVERGPRPWAGSTPGIGVRIKPCGMSIAGVCFAFAARCQSADLRAGARWNRFTGTNQVIEVAIPGPR